MRQPAIKVRPRTGREALNLGVMTARRFFLPLLCAALPLWGISVVFALLVWWIVEGLYAPWCAMAIVWWLKPLYERPVLMRLSKLMFHGSGDWRREQKSAFARGWLQELTLLRLSRGNAPIRHALHLLENVRGREYRARARFLQDADSGRPAIVLLIILESVLLAAVWAMLPVPDGVDFADIMQGDSAQAQGYRQMLHTVAAPVYLSVALLSTVLYVCMGFMRYLNRRIISEGWAIALNMQALSTRLPGICLAVMLALAVFATPPACAVDAAQSASDKAWVEAQVNDPENGPIEIRKVRRSDTVPASPHFTDKGTAFAEFIRTALIIAGVCIALYFAVAILGRRRIAAPLRRAQKPHDAAHIARESDARAVENITAALRYWQAGQMIAALAVLYGRMIARPDAHHLPAFLQGESESEYLQRAKARISPQQALFLSEFFTLWQRVVYGRESPGADAVHAVILHYQSLWGTYA